MVKTATRHHRKSNSHKLKGDLAKIKSALVGATHGLRGRTGRVLTDSIDSLKEHSSTLQNSVANYTADRPFKTLGVAMLAGMLIGYLIHK